MNLNYENLMRIKYMELFIKESMGGTRFMRLKKEMGLGECFRGLRMLMVLRNIIIMLLTSGNSLMMMESSLFDLTLF